MTPDQQAAYERLKRVRAGEAYGLIYDFPTCIQQFDAQGRDHELLSDAFFELRAKIEAAIAEIVREITDDTNTRNEKNGFSMAEMILHRHLGETP